MNLTPGTYWGKLQESVVTELGTNGTPALVLVFQLTHIADGGGWKPIAPTNRDCPFWLSSAARPYSFADLGKLGFNGDFDNPQFDAEMTDGCPIDLINEVYEGKTNDRIRPSKLKQGGDKKPAPKELRAKLAAQYRLTGQAAAKPAMPPPAPLAAAHCEPVVPTAGPAPMPLVETKPPLEEPPF